MRLRFNARQATAARPRLRAPRAEPKLKDATAEQPTPEVEPVTIPYVEGEPDIPADRLVRMESTILRTRQVKECGKPLGEYMTLPASQYSVLDGAKVERLTDDTFRVEVAAFTFFGFEIQPIMTVTVKPTDTGCRIELLACKLAGSPVVEAQNSKFTVRMTNKVSYRPVEGEADCKELVSDVVLSMDTCKPKWFVVPNSAVRTAGNAVMATILGAAVPRFLAQLEKDYEAWAAGNDSREALGTGEFL